MSKCPSCGTDDALILITSIFCVKNECINYDAAWAEEQLTLELEEAYRKKDVSKVTQKLKDFRHSW